MEVLNARGRAVFVANENEHEVLEVRRELGLEEIREEVRREWDQESLSPPEEGEEEYLAARGGAGGRRRRRERA